MKKKKKNRTLPILAAVIVVLAVGYLILRGSNEKRADAEEAASLEAEEAAVITLNDMEELAHFTYESGGAVMAFYQEDGVWYREDAPDFPLEQSTVSGLAQKLQEVEATRRLTDPEERSSYGLADPAVTATATDGSGVTFTLFLGDAAGSDVYAAVEGSDEVYTVSGTLSSSFTYDWYALIRTEEIPYAEEDILRIKVETDGNTWEIRKEVTWEEADDGTEEEETEEESEAERTETVRWYRISEDGAAALVGESATAEILATDAAGLAVSECVNYKLEEDDWEAYGLADPVLSITVTYETEDGEEGDFTLLIGDQDEETGYYYGRSSLSDALNGWTSGSVEPLLELSYDTLAPQ